MGSTGVKVPEKPKKMVTWPCWGKGKTGKNKNRTGGVPTETESECAQRQQIEMFKRVGEGKEWE